MILNIFSCICFPSVWLLWKMSIQILCLFLIRLSLLLLSWMSSLHILHIKSLPDILFVNTFSHSVGDLFIWWWIPSLCRSFFVWCSPYVYFCFCISCLWNQIRKSIAKNDVKEFYCIYLLLRVLWFQVLYSTL